MTFKEFNEIIVNDSDLQKKFDEAKKSLKNENIKDKNELLSKAAAKLGYDVKPSEFNLKKISAKQLNDDELEAVTGGRGGVTCEGDFTDTDCWMNDYCQIGTNAYTLNTCLYSHDGFCMLEDACFEFDTQYYCDSNFTYKHICNWQVNELNE